MKEFQGFKYTIILSLEIVLLSETRRGLKEGGVNAYMLGLQQELRRF